MPFFYQYDDGIRLEVTDDGALVFLNYDIENDLMKVDLLGEEKSPAVMLLEDWEERPIPTLFNLQEQYAGAEYGPRLYKDISKTWILDAALFLGRNQCIKYEIAKEAIKYIKTENFEESFQDALMEGYIKKVSVWSSAFTDAIDKYRSVLFIKQLEHDGVVVVKDFFTSNDLFTIKFDVERAIGFCKISEEAKAEFRHGMLLNLIEAMRTYR
jgi:hypothetical protein